MGLFGKKSKEDLVREKDVLEQKIREQSKVAQAYSEKKALMRKIEQRKEALSKLKKIKDDNFYRRIKSKTSPAIRRFESKVKKNLPAVKQGLAGAGAGFGAVGEGAVKIQSGLFDMKPPSKTSSKRRRKNSLW